MSTGRELARIYFQRRLDLCGPLLFTDRDMDASRNAGVAAAEAEVISISDLDAYRLEIQECTKCPLGATRTKFVFGVGNPAAGLVFVGEAPGRQEDLQGEPFVGRSGKLLDQMLAAIDHSRKSVYILNVIKCRPPDNRNPLSSEVDICENYLKEQLRIIRPKLIVPLGLVAARTLLRSDESLQSLRGRRLEYADIEVRVTYHPAALLRNPRLKAPAWEDFQFIRDRHQELSTTAAAAN